MFQSLWDIHSFILRFLYVTVINKKWIYSFTALLLPSVLVNIIVIVVYFYPRLRLRYPELILVVIIAVSEAGYMTIHSISRAKPSEWVGMVDTASSSEPEGHGFASRLVFFFL